MGNARSIPDPSQNSQLIQACIKGDILTVNNLVTVFKSRQWSLDSNLITNVNGKQAYVKFSALWIACAQGYTEIAQILLNHGADPYFQYDTYPRNIIVTCSCEDGDCEFCRNLGFLYETTPIWITYYMKHQPLIQLFASRKTKRPRPDNHNNYPIINGQQLLATIINAPSQIARIDSF